MSTHTEYEDTCQITELKSGKTVTGEILRFTPGRIIEATINRAAKVTLIWNAQHKVYIGSMAGLEFQSPGPTARTYRTRR